jgi:AraC family transcriptional regulator
MTSPGLRRAACRLYSEFRSADPVSDVAIESIALDVLVSAARTGTETDGGKWLPRVKEILQEQYAQRLPLREIADAVGVHETHLAKAFRHRYGCTVGDYVRDLRLEQARNDLERTKDSLAEIALRHGFCDQAHFSRSFRLAYGTTPSAYRSRR